MRAVCYHSFYSYTTSAEISSPSPLLFPLFPGPFRPGFFNWFLQRLKALFFSRIQFRFFLPVFYSAQSRIPFPFPLPVH